MRWRDIYNARTTNAEAAAALVKSGFRVALGTQCAEPQSLVESLVARSDDLRDVELIGSVMGSACPYAQPNMKGRFVFKPFMAGKETRAGIAAGIVDYVPAHLSQISRLFATDAFRPDIAMIQVAPPDEQGDCSLGVSVDYLPDAIRNARIVVAEVNDRMPYTLGETRLHVSKIDHFVRTSRTLLTVSSQEGPAERKIAENIVPLVQDGSTLQIGMGNVPVAVAKMLRGKSGLRIHTGLLSDWIVDLSEAGSLDASLPIVATIIAGTQSVYDFVNRNSRIQLRPSSHTHDFAVLAGLPNFVAINSALEIDLTGQVNCEGVGKGHLAGTGGLSDFAGAANRIPGAISIIALPSTTASGRESRIVRTLSVAGGVSLPRTDVHYVVTEFGVADLRGAGLHERAARLAAIAHPDFREQLT